MGGLRKTVFAKTKYKINTYIGGIGIVYNTPSLLANKLAININSIKNFKVTNGNISCSIINTYNIPNDCFQNSAVGLSSPTYYYDIEGKVTTIKANAFYNSRNTSRYYFPNVTSIGATCFYNANFGFPNINYQYFPKAIAIGANITTNEAIWANGRGLVKLFINDYLKTVNNGNPDQDLVIGASSHGVNITYLTGSEKTTPNSIIDVSTGTVYRSALQINFTPPSSVYTILMYEVWIDGYYYTDIKTSGQYIYGLNANQTYIITLYSIDIYGNRSFASNSVLSSTNNKSTIPIDGLQAYYKMDETEGTVINDYLSINNATNNGATINQATLVGSGYSLNGSTNYINLGNPIAFQFSTGSFAFWVKSGNKLDNPRQLLTKSGAYTYNLVYGNLHGAKQICDDEWHLVVLNIGIGTNNSQSYVDGVLIWSGTINISNQSGNIIIGSSSNGYAGLIDEMAVYNRKLTQQEQLLMCNNRKGSTI
ncbi:LamG-like jellyroll fold domain-containing protein [Flavobacterium sp. Root420]|uniref:LamG-like jellyroll fold domain-containing protein n=1 Tax=Flavobacterium sp. Root420 TaxID=1736533 RepID=UPI000701E6B9|nr:LamG-like jellyroll fold domain-containing protein [Flavobacterium sp. Root420]KQX15322.1 hypothetical protein ASC72_00120 [Flavobacterium sp. Root420]